VPASTVVEALDVVEDGGAQLGFGWPAAAVDEVAFQGLEERFAEGVVVGAAASAHRLLDPGEAAAAAEGKRDILRPLVGVMDESAVGSASLQRLLQCVDDELGAEVVFEGPANNAAAVTVDDHGEVEPALPATEVGDVGDPEPVRRRRPEVALDEIVSDAHTPGTRIVVQPRRRLTVPLIPACRISRSTRLRPTATPSARKSR